MRSGCHGCGGEGCVWMTSAPMATAFSGALSIPPRVETCPPISMPSIVSARLLAAEEGDSVGLEILPDALLEQLGDALRTPAARHVGHGALIGVGEEGELVAA